MPYDSAGNFSLVPSYKATPGQTIRTEQHNPPLEDMASALSSVLVRDGRNGMVGPLNMGSFPITNVETSQTATSAATVGQIQSAAPIGSVIDFAGDTAPDGWLLCYGQAVSRTTFADLFAVIGIKYGAGNGSTTFNVPDARDVVIVGRGNMGGTARGLLSKFASTTLGALFGVQEHALTTNQLASHTHTGTTGSAGAHTHTISLPRGDNVFNQGNGNTIWGSVMNWLFTTTSAGAHTHSFTTNSTGSGQAHPNVQPSLVMNKIIRATY